MAEDGPSKPELQPAPEDTPLPEMGATTVAPDIGVLDLEKDDNVPPETIAAGPPPPPESKPYDPLPEREQRRGQIAQALIALLAILVLFSFLTLWLCPWASSYLKDLLTIFFAPIATLVGSAIGFYFGGGGGAQKNQSSQ
jgi:hypothetical protein